MHDIHFLFLDVDGGRDVFGRTAESYGVAHHDGADGKGIVIEGMRCWYHCDKRIAMRMGSDWQKN